MARKPPTSESEKSRVLGVLVTIQLLFAVLLAFANFPGVVYATGWSARVLITNDNANNTAPSAESAVAADLFNNVHVVWADLSELDGSGTDRDIFYKKWNSATKSWGPRVHLSRDSTNRSAGPEVAADSFGNIHVVWRDYNDSAVFPFKGTIQHRMWSVSSGNWDIADFLTNETFAYFNLPRIAGDPFGNIHFVATTGAYVFYMEWNGTTRAWSAPSTMSAPGANAQWGRLSVDGGGNVHVAWHDDTDILGSGTDWDIYYRRLDWLTGSWGPVQLVTSDNVNNTGISTYSDVGSDPFGNAHVVWVDLSELDGSGPDYDIFYKRFDASTGTWGSRILVTDDNVNNTDGSDVPSVTGDFLGNAHIMWIDSSDLDGSGNDKDIFYRKWNALTGSWEKRFPVTDPIANGGRSVFPRIATDLLGNAHVVWQDVSPLDGSGDDSDIFYRKWESGIILPDYVPTDVSPSMTEYVLPGSSNPISGRVYNGGNVSNTMSTIAFYNSTTPASPFFQATVPPLNTAEKSSPYQATWMAPSIPGRYEITIEVDYLDDISEMNEDNNNMTIEFVVLGIDYIPHNVLPSSPQYVSPNSLSMISASVKNQGTALSANQSTIAFYNSTTPTTPFFENSSVPELSANESSSSYQAEWRAPDVPGTYQIAIEVDYEEDIAEFDETNNVILIEFNVVSVPPPTNLTLIVSNVDDILLNWTAPDSPLLDHYLIYRATDQRDFDFTNPVHNTSTDPNPLATYWTDLDATGSSSPREYYYVVRSVNQMEMMSTTSNTAGKWTRSFREGRDAFSLPLEPFVNKNVSWYSEIIPGTEFIRWMNATGHWVTHYPSMGEGVNDIPAIMGDSYEISLTSSINFTFCGYPASMIRFQEGLGDSLVFRKSLSAQVEGNDVNLSWEAVTGAISYLVFRSEERSGLHNLSLLPKANTTETYWIDSGVIGSGRGEYYYMIIPVDTSGSLGSSTYGVGVFTVEYQSGSDSFSLPLKPLETRSLDWYCDNIPSVVGLIHLIKGYWRLHAREMPEGVYDVEALQGEGYQILIDGPTTTYTFVGY